MSEANIRMLAEQLQTRGTVPECFAGVLIGITEVERDLIVKALLAAPEVADITGMALLKNLAPTRLEHAIARALDAAQIGSIWYGSEEIAKKIAPTVLEYLSLPQRDEQGKA